MEKLIDNNSYKILNKAYKSEIGLNRNELFRKYKFDVKSSINLLFKYKFITYSELDQIVHGEVIYNSSVILITDKGKIYVQNQRHDKLQFRIPLIISIVASILSVISFYRP